MEKMKETIKKQFDKEKETFKDWNKETMCDWKPKISNWNDLQKS